LVALSCSKLSFPTQSQTRMINDQPPIPPRRQLCHERRAGVRASPRVTPPSGT
jgi:hypothetical protein